MSFDPRVKWGHIIPAEQPIAGVNERCIELPLAMGVMAETSAGARVLDAGCSLNQIVFAGARWRAVYVTQNIGSEPIRGEASRSYVSADLRDLSLFADGVFETTVCVSTLEHVGMDNRHYGASEEHDPDSMWKAVRELLRLTGKRLFITVPFGEGACDKFRPWQVDDLGKLVAILDEYLDVVVSCAFYAVGPQGWYGGSSDMVPPQITAKVSQIACIRIDKV